MGEVILATTKMARIVDVQPGRITVEPGVTVAAMQERLTEAGAWFPPVPTFTGACAGGIVATNAAGAATFKYGSTRDWVEALTVVLADGTVLELESRQRARARTAGSSSRRRADASRCRCRRYRMPRVAKRSAGYHAAPDMDLIDLFIGSEGTLGVITQITFRTLSPAPNIVLAWIPCTAEAQGLALVKALRDASMTTWQTGATGRNRCLRDRAHGSPLARDCPGGRRRHDGSNVSIPEGTELALLVQLELSGGNGCGPRRSSRFRNRSEVRGPTARSGTSAACSIAQACSRTPSWRPLETAAAPRTSSPCGRPCPRA